jgi:diguanylate cyclase (GGDEF)-like protein
MNIFSIRRTITTSLRTNYHSLRFLLNLQMIIASALVIFLILGIRQLGGFESLELVAFDRMIKARPDIGEDPRLLIVGITEKDIKEYEFPIPDRVIADTLEEIAKHDPDAIGLDIYRDKSKLCEAEGHQALLEQMKRPNLFVITKGRPGEDNYIPSPPSVPNERVGFNDLSHDPDAVMRRNVIFMLTETGDYLQSFSFRIASYYLKKLGIEAKVNPENLKQIYFGKSSFFRFRSSDGGYQTADDNAYQIILNYRPTYTVAKRVSLQDILNKNVDPQYIRGKIVLLGTTAQSGKDLFVTPMSKKNNLHISGLEIHAHMVSQFISAALGNSMSQSQDYGYNPIFWFLPESIEILWIILCGIWGCFIAWRVQHPFWVSMISMVSIAIIVSFKMFLFNIGLWMPVVTPAITIVLSAGTILGAKFVHNVLYDEMTGLPNRVLFASRLRRFKKQSILREKTRNLINMEKFPQPQLDVAVLLLDIDRFKIFHAVLGQAICDDLLMAFAKRIQKVLNITKKREENYYLLSRSGEDEFAILLKNPSNKEEALNIANEIQRQMSKPFRFEQEIFTSSNIGISFGIIGDDRELLRDAYAAMNQAKALGKNKPEIFEYTMESNAIERFHLERDLRRAVTKSKKEGDAFLDDSLTYHSFLTEFIVYYQPLISLETGKIIGFEALIRWQHPERGLVSPADFIPVAEETGVIIHIGEWVLREACQQAVKWMKKFPIYEELIISVNLSAKQFEESDIVKTIKKVLSETVLPPNKLKLEITESMAMKNLEATLAKLNELEKLNIKLSIDDFGTGYSSLAYVSQFPLDTLKVDRSFLLRMDNNEESQIIVKTIIGLAHDLHLEVIAEGIENEGQLQKLKMLNCEYGQGYLFSRPVTRDNAEALLDADLPLYQFDI